jgi:DNA mismatch endonuclease, patch repair protein
MDSINHIRDGRAPIPEHESTSRLMSTIKGRNTKPELNIRRELWKKRIRGYRLHWKKVPGTPDISFPGKKIAIFINGCFWHRCPNCNPPIPKSHSNFWYNKFQKNVERDKIKIQQLNENGWRTIILWECQINADIDGCTKRLINCIIK